MDVKKWLKDDSGFSLIEVILAVTILALVTLPIINYFTYSSLRTIDARDKQTATTAAEDVIEELRSCSNYEQIQELAATAAPGTPSATPPAWKISNVVGATERPDTVEMERDLKLNGFTYHAKAKLDFDLYDKETRVVNGGEEIGSGTGSFVGDGAGAVKKTEFNDYKIPRPSEVYSASNVVAVEDDQIDTALSEFYSTVNASTPSSSDTGGEKVSMSTIQGAVDRTICMDVSYKDSTKKVYTVRVYYQYEYGGNKTEVTVENSDIETHKFKNIYLFYNLLRGSVVSEKVRVQIDDQIPTEDIEKMKIYFALQDTASVAKPLGYHLKKVASTNSKENYVRYYTNDIPSTDFPIQNIVTTPGTSTGSSFVDKELGNRIARVTVDIYEVGPSASTDSIAHTVTTMAE